ncbi:hypothetical protein B566_EDAN008169 [Ephemera danica]|nr:hypothetical protein B566_EDAN008169 [Ephemera danica]
MPAPCEEIIDDIEDLISSQDITPKQRYSSKKSVTIRRRKQQPDSASKIQEAFVPNVERSVIPGTQKVYVKTWGCTHNTSDSEYMAGQLAAYGYKIVTDDEKNNADVWLLNSCTVKNPAEDHFRNEVKAAQDLGKAVVVAGCVPQGAPRSEYLHGVSTVGVQQIDRVVEVVEETLKALLQELDLSNDCLHTEISKFSCPKENLKRNIINLACIMSLLNQFSISKSLLFFSVQIFKGPAHDVTKPAHSNFKNSYRQNRRLFEIENWFSRLLLIHARFIIFLFRSPSTFCCNLISGMTNPPYILEHLPEMAELLCHPRVYSFLHVPVQSGSDAVLADMKREYSRDDFEHVVTFLRERVPGINIATDIICGFPTETEADFAETIDLCSKFKFPSLFINQFFPRPGTPAGNHQ